MATARTEGCNKMVCGYCNEKWCWRCGAAIAGYDHFGAGACRLFEQDELDRWQAQVAADEAAEAAFWGGGGGGGGGFRAGENAGVQQQQQHAHRQGLCTCPVCGQRNWRVARNNHVRCFSCAQHFCAACGEWLRTKPGNHFLAKGAGRCKQHS